MKKKSGFSTVELLVSFIIISFLMIAMFRSVLILSEKLFFYHHTARLTIFRGNLMNAIQKDLIVNGYSEIEECYEDSSNCYILKFANQETKVLNLDIDEKVITYGAFGERVPKGANFNGDILIDSEVIDVDDSLKSVLQITIPLISEVFNLNYDINIIYQIREIKQDSLLASKIEDDKDVILKNEAYFYVGANPNNWIEFGTIGNPPNDTPVLWRIIKSNGEGIKIIYEGKKKGNATAPDDDGYIGNYAWDTSNSNQWESSSLKGVLDEWYTTILNKNEQYVASTKWCVGASSGNLLSTFLFDECESETFKATGIGLIRPSDYMSTSRSEGCTGSGQMACGNDNFLTKGYLWWTHTAHASSPYIWGIYVVTQGDYFFSYINYYAEDYAGGRYYNKPSLTHGVRPVLNLKSDILYDSGEGTISSPYKVK